jgi:hypothetical protein
VSNRRSGPHISSERWLLRCPLLNDGWPGGCWNDRFTGGAMWRLHLYLSTCTRCRPF